MPAKDQLRVPHIRQDIKDHLVHFVEPDLNALLFKPARDGCHLNDRVFNKDVFKRAAKSVGRDYLSAHDLRRFAIHLPNKSATAGDVLAQDLGPGLDIGRDVRHGER